MELCRRAALSMLTRTTFKRTMCSRSTPALTVVTQTDGIRTIQLDNAKKRNVLSLAMLKEVKSNVLEGLDKSDIRVIIIKHEGNVFSSGHDLKELKTSGYEKHQEIFRACTELMTLIQDVPVPVVAQVDGLATAAGCQLVASCDIAVASDISQFATPGVNVGLFCSTPAVAVSRSVPRKVALEMLFTGFPMSAQDALKHGLVSKVVPADQLEEETMKIARKICETSKSVVAMGKQCFNIQTGKTRDEAYRYAESVMVTNLMMKDGQEGIDAFLNKRKPQWSHEVDRN